MIDRGDEMARTEDEGVPASEGSPSSTAPSPGDEVEVVIDQIAAGGDGFGRLASGLSVFTDIGLPGDRVRGEVTHVRKRFARVRVMEISEPGPARRESECPYAALCGGCRFWGAGYDDELRWKVEATVESVRRLSGEASWPEPTVVPAETCEGYRERARVRVRSKSESGFFAVGTNELVATDTCRVLHPAIDAARSKAASFFGDVRGLEAVWLEWDDIRHAVAITAEVTRQAELGARGRVQRRIEQAQPLDEISTIAFSSGGRTRALIGDARVERRRPVGDRGVVVAEPAGGFSQVGGAMNAALQSVVLSACADVSGRDGAGEGTEEVAAAGSPRRPVVLELFAGAGNLTFPLLGAGFDVDSVEGVTPAVHAAAAAWKGLEKRPPTRARFYAHDLGASLPEPVIARLGSYAVVVVDPPRGGLRPDLVAAVSRSSATRLVYVSCDPAALARDAGRLAADGWRVAGWTLLDLFARTPHVEAVTTFERSR